MAGDVYPIVKEPQAITIEHEGTEYALDRDCIRALTQIALWNSCGYAQALCQCIANEAFMSDVEASGGRLLIEKDGDIRYLERVPTEVPALAILNA